MPVYAPEAQMYGAPPAPQFAPTSAMHGDFERAMAVANGAPGAPQPALAPMAPAAPLPPGPVVFPSEEAPAGAMPMAPQQQDPPQQ